MVTQQGLVGRIDAVISDAARIQLITDAGSVVNVRLKNANVEGQVRGSITGEVSLDMVPIDSKVDIGEVILTSGLGGTYPTTSLWVRCVRCRRVRTRLFQTGSVKPVLIFQLKCGLVILPILTLSLFHRLYPEVCLC